MIHGGNVWMDGAAGKWLDFSASLRPEGPPAWVIDALNASLSDTRFYPDPEMTRAKRGLAAYTGLPEDWILPAAGGEAAIDLSLTHFSGCVYTQELSFGEYAIRAAAHQRKHTVWQNECQSGDTLILANPNNPTGKAMSREALLSLRDRLRGNGAELIVDEAFIDFCPEYSLRQDIGNGLMIVGSLTKILGIPGVRLGYLCAEPQVIDGMRRRMLPWALSAQATEIAARLPEHLDSIRNDAALNKQRREDFSGLLKSLDAHFLPSQSNFLLVDFGRDMTEAVSRLRARGILVRECLSFGLPGNYLRLAVKTEEENRRLIQELEGIFHAG